MSRLATLLIGMIMIPLAMHAQGHNENTIEITPYDTTVTPGSAFQFSAVLKTDSSEVERTFTWEVSDTSLASIDADGNFLAKGLGEVEVLAKLDSLSATAEVSIEVQEEEDEEGPAEFRIVPSDTTIFVGEFVVLRAQYFTANTWTDTTATFELSNNELADLGSGDSLYALRAGDLKITAALDSLTAEAEIEIREQDENEGEISERIVLTPEDTLVGIGASISFQAFNSATFDTLTDSVSWSITPAIGTIDSTGTATFSSVGFALIKAEFNGLEGSASVRVEDQTEDTTGVQSIVVYIPRNNPDVPPSEHNISEGEVLTLSGFASPLNYLNGGTVYFPLGSLKEDIRIDVNREDYSGTTEDGKRIVGGIGFNVFVNDTLKSPYEFEEPIEISIPFKRGLLRNLGIDVGNLSIFNMEDDGSMDTVGVSSVVVDSAGGRIFGYVSHFSKYVLSPKEDVITSTHEQKDFLPSGIKLGQNYPNPFNPGTRINVTLSAKSDVNVVVYDLLGRKVATIVNSRLSAGIHTFEFNGSNLASGLYLYRLSVDGSFVKSRIMTLLK